MNLPFQSIQLLKLLVLLSALLLSSSCSLQTYKPKPLAPKQALSTFQSRTLNNPDLKRFLAANNLALPRSAESWSLDALTHTALFFHADLSASRESYKAAQLAIKQGKQKPVPSISTQIANSNRANGDINPFGLSFSIGLPIQTNDKQAIRIARLTHLSEIRQLEVAQTAWKIRSRVVQTALSLHHQANTVALLNQEVALKQTILAILQKRFNYGETSSLTVHQAQQSLSQSQQRLLQAKQAIAPLKATLAKQMGLPISEASKIVLSPATFSPITSEQTANLSFKKTQSSALLNRLDIRKAILSYAVAEQNLKLAFAKQIPDITLNPGYAFEFGDSVWSLGFSSLLTLLKKNKVGIEQAEQLREQEMAKFIALQNSVIGDTQIANANLQAQLAIQSSLLLLKKQSQQQLSRIQKQLSAGLMSRLDVILAKLKMLSAELQVLNQQNTSLKAMVALEDTLQVPIFTQSSHALDILTNEPQPLAKSQL